MAGGHDGPIDPSEYTEELDGYLDAVNRGRDYGRQVSARARLVGSDSRSSVVNRYFATALLALQTANPSLTADLARSWIMAYATAAQEHLVTTIPEWLDTQRYLSAVGLSPVIEAALLNTEIVDPTPHIAALLTSEGSFRMSGRSGWEFARVIGIENSTGQTAARRIAEFHQIQAMLRASDLARENNTDPNQSAVAEWLSGFAENSGVREGTIDFSSFSLWELHPNIRMAVYGYRPIIDDDLPNFTDTKDPYRSGAQHALQMQKVFEESPNPSYYPNAIRVLLADAIQRLSEHELSALQSTSTGTAAQAEQRFMNWVAGCVNGVLDTFREDEAKEVNQYPPPSNRESRRAAGEMSEQIEYALLRLAQDNHFLATLPSPARGAFLKSALTQIINLR